MKQVTCPKCGRQYPEDAVACPGCKHSTDEQKKEEWCSEDDVLNFEEVGQKEGPAGGEKGQTQNNGRMQQRTRKKVLTRPDDNLAWSLVTAFFCFWPTGIAAAICSMKVDYFWFKGEKDYAEELAERAKRLRLISLEITLGVAFLVFIIAAATDGFD